MRRYLLICGVALLAQACVNKNIEPPTPLVHIANPKYDVDTLWSHSIGDTDAILRLGVVVASDGTNVYAANHDGDVYAYTVTDGDKVWSADTDMPLSGGPAVGGGLVVVASESGIVLALKADTGEKVWQTPLDGEIIASPVVGHGDVVVRTTDGRLLALDVRTGAVRWKVPHDVPKLTLRGASQPLIADNLAIDGMDSGMLTALSLEDGSQKWAIPVGTPTGSDELSRLADLDGVVTLRDGILYSAAYQGQTAAVSADSGQTLWTRSLSSYTGASADADHVYVADTHSEVWGLDRKTGVPVWTQKGLRARNVTVPVPYLDTVVMGDLDGYIHFLSKSDGSFAARTTLGGDPILAPPLVVGDEVIVLTTSGKLAAFRATPVSAAGG